MSLVKLYDLILLSKPNLHSEIFTKSAIDKLLNFAKEFPISGSSIILECRLDKNIQVDLTIGLNNISKDSYYLKNWILDKYGSKGTESKWKALNSFFSHWTNPDSLIHDNVRLVWLEFDLPTSQHKTQNIPSVFFTINQPYSYLYPQSKESFLQDCLDEFLLDQVKYECFYNLQKCLQKLPFNSKLINLGVMLPRTKNIIRMCVELNKSNLLRYLKDINWPGNFFEIEKILSISNNYKDTFQVDFDISPNLQESIGIEFGFHSKVSGDENLGLFLDKLETCGFCLETKKKSLLSWAGYSYEYYNNNPLPLVFSRRISHIKLSCNQSNLSAKAYLSLKPRYNHFAT